MPPLHDTQISIPLQDFTGSWEQDIVTRLPADYASRAVEKKAFQRARHIRCPQDLLRGLLAYVLSSYSLRALSCWATLTDLADGPGANVCARRGPGSSGCWNRCWRHRA